MGYLNRRITLLIDDPPTGKGADLTELEAARALVTELDDLFRRASRQFRVAANNSNVRLLSDGLCLEKERVILAGLYVEAADFVSRLGLLYVKRSQPVFAHADEVFAREVISHLDAEYRRLAVALSNQADCDVERIRLEYRRLVNLFDVPIDCFERKRFGNLSHAPNKAMNLNSYIGLIGRAFRVSKGSDGMSVLKDCPESEADLIVPAADYVVTIDANSIILPDYIGIEDTGSTIDLVANLIILPSLLALWHDRGPARAGGLQTFVRSHYLISPALANVGLLLLLVDRV
jgi:hypothetical protein